MLINLKIPSGVYFGIPYFNLPFPRWLLYATGIAALKTSGACVPVLFSKMKMNSLSAGIVGYVTSIYVWLIFLWHPILALIIPAFHSLQYLSIVWRFQWNKSLYKAKTASGAFEAMKSNVTARFTAFWIVGILLGWMMFDFVPGQIEPLLSLDGIGSAVTLSFWVFINIHHYFIDSVLWKKENPEVVQYLFPRTVGT